MKKIAARKHGHKARVESGLNAPQPLKRTLTFETSCQSYLWVIDRGRSRLIKH